MTPVTGFHDESTTLWRLQVGPSPGVLPYANSVPLREIVGEPRTDDIDRQIAAIMPSIAEIASLGTEHFKEWQDDKSWADYDEK